MIDWGWCWFFDFYGFFVKRLFWKLRFLGFFLIMVVCWNLGWFVVVGNSCWWIIVGWFVVLWLCCGYGVWWFVMGCWFGLGFYGFCLGFWKLLGIVWFFGVKCLWWFLVICLIICLRLGKLLCVCFFFREMDFWCVFCVVKGFVCM